MQTGVKQLAVAVEVDKRVRVGCYRPLGPAVGQAYQHPLDQQLRSVLHTRFADIVQGLSCRLPYLSADGEGEGERRTSGIDISILMPELLRLLLSGLCSFGLRRLRCRSTHFSIVSTESVLGRRLSAAVRTI